MNATDLIVYADFNCATCYLASRRADRLLDRGVRVRWRAVEHDPHLSLLGASDAADRRARLHDLAEAAGLARPGELLPTDIPPITTNTRAAVAAYAEAVADGVQDEVRRRIYHAIWEQRRHLSSAYEVRRIITDVMYPRVPVGPRRATSLPQPMTGDPDPWTLTRHLGGTISPDAVPLTTAGYRRVRAWREQWLAFPRQRLPIVVDADGAVFNGALALARLLPDTPAPEVQPVPTPELATVFY